MKVANDKCSVKKVFLVFDRAIKEIFRDTHFEEHLQMTASGGVLKSCT